MVQVGKAPSHFVSSEASSLILYNFLSSRIVNLFSLLLPEALVPLSYHCHRIPPH